MPGLAEPWWLLLLPAPWLLARLLPALAAVPAAMPVPPRLAARLAGAAGGSQHAWWGPALLWAFLVVALADPRWPRLAEGLTASGRDIILAIDLSGSMGAVDVERDGRRISRLDAVKAAAGAFVTARPGDRVGLLFFAEEAYLAAAPSFDHAAVRHLLGEAEIGLAGRGTAMGDALGLALKRLQGGPARERSIVLLSDGVNNAGEVEPEEAARLAASLHVTIHAIALTPPGGGGSAREAFAVARPALDMDPDALRRLADATGGRFFEAATAAALDAAYGSLSRELAEALPAPPVVIEASLAWVPLAGAYGLCLLLLGRRRGA